MDYFPCDVNKVALFSVFSLLISILFIIAGVPFFLTSWISLSLIYYLAVMIKCSIKNGNNNDLGDFISSKWLLFLVALWIILPSIFYWMMTYDKSVCDTSMTNYNLSIVILALIFIIILPVVYVLINKNIMTEVDMTKNINV